jgi:hypothetical protein
VRRCGGAEVRKKEIRIEPEIKIGTGIGIGINT